MSLVREKERIDLEEERWKAQLDASRRELVMQLCGQKGQELFLFLLVSSTHHPNQHQVAVVSLRRLRDVATQLGWSHDTVKRYVAVFRALNLIHHYREHRQEVTLHIPLGPYTPLTNFAALDDLIKTRKKQSQLATNVKARYILRFGDPSQAHSDTVHQGLEEIKDILDHEHLEPMKRQRLQMKMADLLARLIKAGQGALGDPKTILESQQDCATSQQPGGFEVKEDLNDIQGTSYNTEISNPESPDTLGDPEHLLGDLKGFQSFPVQSTSQEQGDSNANQGDLIAQSSLAPAYQSQQQGDSKYPQGDLKDPQSFPVQRQGDSKQLQGDLTTTIATQQVISSTSQTTTLGDPDQRQGDPKPFSAVETDLQGDPNIQNELVKGDSNTQAPKDVQLDDLLTYNVNYLINNINSNNVIRKRLAQYLGMALENNPNAFIAYLKIFKQYTPEVVGRAFICTMVVIHHKKWQLTKPGAWFTSQCRALSGQADLKGYTLEEVEKWLCTWGDISYRDLLTILPVPSDVKPAPLTPASLIKSTEQSPSIKKGMPGYFSSGASSVKKKRTYGMHLTQLPSGKKGFNNLGSALPPPHLRKS